MGATIKTLESAGSAIANLALVQAVGANYSVESDGAGFPDADFALVGTFGVAPTEGTVLALYARPLDVDGTRDTEAPEAARPTRFIGTFVVNNVTTEQAMMLEASGLPRLAEYHVHNNGTGQQLNAGWTLKVTPRTEKLAP